MKGNISNLIETTSPYLFLLEELNKHLDFVLLNLPVRVDYDLDGSDLDIMVSEENYD